MAKSLAKRVAGRIERERFRVVARVKPRAHFLHVGKTGGSAIRATLQPVRTRGKYAIELHRHGVTLSDLPPSEPFFLCVRDPISRFVSGFYGRQRCDRPRYDVPHRHGEAEAFARFQTPNELAEAIGTTAGDDAMRSIQHVRDHYWHWAVDPETFAAAVEAERVLAICRTETLEADFKRLLARLGLPPVDLPSDDAGAHRNPSHVDRSLSGEAQLKLREWYRADFEFLALCAEFSLISAT